MLALALACLPVTHGALAQAADVHGLGRVREDGSLLVADTVVHLTGIYIPSLRRECQTTGCMPHAVRTLRRKVGGFVHCAIVAERGDGSLEGFCSTAGRGVLDPRTDLGAWLIEQGSRSPATSRHRSISRWSGWLRHRAGVFGPTCPATGDGAVNPDALQGSIPQRALVALLAASYPAPSRFPALSHEPAPCPRSA